MATLVALAAPSATAADTVVVPWRPGAIPAGAGFWSNACPGNDDPQLRTALDADDEGYQAASTPSAGAAAGDVAWTLPTTGSTQGGPSVAVTGAAVGTVTGLTIDVVGPATGRFLAYYTSDDGKTIYYGTAGVSTGAGWQTLQPDSINWYEKKKVLPDLFGEWKTPSTQSLAAFASARGTGTLLLGYEFGCAADTAVSIDHLVLTSTAGSTDYDFATLTSSTTLTASSSVVTGAGSTWLTASVADSADNAVSAGRVRVQARAFGQHTWSPVATISPNASTKVHPRTRTAYRLSYLGSTEAEPSRSPAVAVTVQPTVTARASVPRTVAGAMVKVTGRTRPARRNVPVTIQRRIGARWVLVARATTRKGGKYAARVKVTSGGTWRMRARLARSAGNARAKSRPVRVRVEVAPSITARVAPRSVVAGDRYVITGRARHARTGTTVRLQVRSGRGWHTFSTTRLHGPSRYRFRPRATTTGRFTLRVVLVRSGHHLRATSPTLRLVVRPAPTHTPSTDLPDDESPDDGSPGGVGHG